MKRKKKRKKKKKKNMVEKIEQNKILLKDLVKNIKIILKEKENMSIKREKSTIIHYNYNIKKNSKEKEIKNVRKKRLKSSEPTKYNTEDNLKLPIIQSSYKRDNNMNNNKNNNRGYNFGNNIINNRINNNYNKMDMLSGEIYKIKKKKYITSKNQI